MAIKLNPLPTGRRQLRWGISTSREMRHRPTPVMRVSISGFPMRSAMTNMPRQLSLPVQAPSLSGQQYVVRRVQIVITVSTQMIPRLICSSRCRAHGHSLAALGEQSRSVRSCAWRLKARRSPQRWMVRKKILREHKPTVPCPVAPPAFAVMMMERRASMTGRAAIWVQAAPPRVLAFPHRPA